MKFFPSRFASSIVLSLSWASVVGFGVGCGDDEAGTGGSGGDSAASTSSSASTSTNQSSSSSANGSTGQGGEAAGTGGETGSGGNGAGGDGAGGDGTGGDGTGGTGGRGEGGEGGGSNLCLPSATTVDLADVLERATGLVEEIYGELDEPTIWFQDGLNSVGFSAPNDMGAIVVAFEAPEEIAVFEDELIVYRASVWGIEDIWLARTFPFEGLSWDVDPPEGDDYYQYATIRSGLGTLAEELSEEEGEDFSLDFATAFPGAELIVYGDLGVFVFVNVEPTELKSAFDFLEARPEVDVVEPDGEVYGTDFGFGPRVDLSSQVDDGPFDVYEQHAFLSHWIREEGFTTFNLPTLPEPYGPGPSAQSPEQRYTVGFAEGADVEACLEELELCGFASELEDDVVYLVDPSYVAASALRHECVDYLIAVGSGPV